VVVPELAGVALESLLGVPLDELELPHAATHSATAISDAIRDTSFDMESATVSVSHRGH
jgi:hypothetical protein